MSLCWAWPLPATPSAVRVPTTGTVISKPKSWGSASLLLSGSVDAAVGMKPEGSVRASGWLRT
ncbi:hypothetical protein G6O69_38320 [Pseudenhygromyxa sp. WMMC2535]|nr:hypothetical protein [Pseudenhygromyxa sp. WMMC2535]